MNKTFLFFFFFVLFSVSVVAQPPFQNSQSTADVNALSIIYPKSVSFAKNSEGNFHFHVYNSTNVLITDATCEFHAYNQQNGHITKINLSVEGNEYELEYNSSFTGEVGVVPWVVSCNNTYESGYISSSFYITPNGLYDEYVTPASFLPALIPLILGVFLLVGSITLSEEHSALKIGLFISSLLTFINSSWLMVEILSSQYVFEKLIDNITLTMFLFGSIIGVVIIYFVIHLFIHATHKIAQKKDERFRY